MKYNRIKNDAENVEIKNSCLISIGTKITNKLPKYQYMGIIKFKKKDFLKLKIIKINVILTSKFWYEIDNLADIKFTEKNLW